MMLLGGGATARCGTVRHGDDVTGQLGGGPRREPVKPVFLFGCEVWYNSNTDPGTVLGQGSRPPLGASKMAD